MPNRQFRFRKADEEAKRRMIRIKRLLSMPLRMLARYHRVKGRLGKAETLLEMVSALDQAHVGVALNLARIRIRRERNVEAMQGLADALSPTGFAPDILVELAQLQIDAGELVAARKNLLKASDRDGPQAAISYLSAHIEELEGNDDRAIELARQGLREHPDELALNVIAWRCASRSVSPEVAADMCEAFAAVPDRPVSEILEAARFLRGMNLWDRSLEILERAAKVDSASLEVSMERAECLIGKKELKEASGLLDEVLENSPGDRSAAFAQARCEIGLGEPANALERLGRLEASVGSDPTSVELKVECRLRLADMDVDAETHFRESLSEVRESGSKFPDHPNLIALEIKILRMTGRLQEARMLAERVPMKARRGPAIGALFDVFMDCGWLEQAEAMLSGIPNEHRDASWAKRMRARVLKEQGRLEEAENLLEAICAQEPSMVQIILDLARIRSRRGKMSEAKRGLADSLLAAGFAPAILVELARLQIESGEFESAGGNLKKAAEGNGSMGDIGFLTARIEEMKGGHDRALELARVRLQEDPDDLDLQALSWRCAEKSVSPDKAATMCEAYAARPDCPVEGILEASRFMRGMERWDRSLAILEAAALESVGSEVAKERAKCLIGKNELEEASGLLEEVLEDSPGDRDAALALARCEIGLGKPAKALELLHRLEASAGSDPTSVELKVECRLRLADAGADAETHFRESLSEVREAGSKFPDHPILIALEINILRMTGRLEEARRLAEQVPASVRRGPAIGALFNVFMDCARLEQAEALLSSLPDEHRDAIWAKQMRARVLKEQGRLEEASGLLEEVLEDLPDDRDAALALARCEIDLGEHEKALERLKRLEASAGSDPKSVELKVECRLRLADAGADAEKHFLESLSEVSEAASKFPDHPILIALEIKILRMSGRKEEARRLAERVPASARRGPAIGALFDVFMDVGQLEQADELLSGLPDEHRDSGWAMQLRARVLNEQGRLEEAESLLESARVQEPSKVPIILDLARIRSRRGKIAEAKRGLAESLLTARFAPAILVDLARLQIESWEFQPAIGNLKKVAEVGGPARDIAFLTARIEELKGEHDRALVLARERLRDNPDDFALQALSWRCAERCKSPNEAEEMCEAFVARPDCPPEGLLEAARYLRGRERWDRSLAILEAAALACSSPEVARERAECLIGKNELKTASGLLEEIIEDSPDDRGAELAIARCEAGLGNSAKALERLERLEADAGSDLASTELKAQCRLRLAETGVETESHLREALSGIEKGYSEFPDHPTLVALEIRALRKSGRMEDALSRAEELPGTSIRSPAAAELFDLYIDSHLPDRAEAILSGLPEGFRGTNWARQFHARLLGERMRYADAEALLKKILAEDPVHVPAILEMARIRAKSGRSSMARQQLADALPATGYPNVLLLELAGMLVDDGECEPALELLLQAAERDGSLPAELRFQAARIEELRGNIDRARELAREGLHEHPEDIRFEVMTWRCALADGSRDEAESLCLAFAAHPEIPPDGLMMAARFLKDMQRWNACLSLLDRISVTNPESAVVAKERAECFIGRNEDLKASLTLKKIVGNEPENLWAVTALARCEVELGEVRSGLERLESLNANAATDAEVYELKAECHLRLANLPGQLEERVEKALSIVGEGYCAHPHHPNLVAVEIRALRKAGRNEEAVWRADMIPESSHNDPAIGAIFELYLEAGELEAADAFLSNFPENIRQTSWLTLCRARLLARQGHTAEADAFLEKSLADFPEHEPTLVEFARHSTENGRASEARRRMAEMRASTGLPPKALIELARLQIADREYDAAKDTLEEAVRAGGRTVGATHLTAFLEERKGNAERAIDMAREGLQDHPGHVPFEIILWRCTSMSASRHEAEDLCEAYAMRPDCPAEGLLEASRFMRFLTRWDKSLALLDRVATENPGNPAVALERAHFLLDRRDPLNASLALKDLDRHSPGNRWVEILLAQCEANLGDARSALERLDRLEAKSGTSTSMIQIRAECLQMIGDMSAAEAQLGLLRDADAETRAWAGARRADLALSCGMAAEALAGIEEAVALDPGNMDLNQHRALIRLLNGDFDGALDGDVACFETGYASNISRMPSRKERSSVHGSILNEFRLIGKDLPVAEYFAKRDPVSALPELRRMIEGHEDNTPAAMAMLALMCRAGHVTETPPSAAAEAEPIPKRIFQFWDEPEPPEQVLWLMERNSRSAPDFEFRRCHERGGAEYLREKGEDDAAKSYKQAPNAAAKADILRLALLWHEGGIYLDADDRIVGPLEDLLPAGIDFVGYQETYMCVANNFLAASAGHPVIRAALDMAVRAYIGHRSDELWMASGPGAVTRAIAHRGTTAEGGLAPGIWIMPSFSLRPVVSAHVDLNYKSTYAHWTKELTGRWKS